MSDFVSSGFNALNSIMSFFMSEPLIYFIGATLLGSVATVALKFVPIKRR